MVSDQLDNGYAQSKWVSEQMCHEAAQRGLPGCVNLGSVPDRSDWLFDMITPAKSCQRRLLRNGSAVCSKTAPLKLKKLAAGIDSFEIYLQSDKELLQTAGISYPSVNKELLVT
ncbi:hypothetical protein PsorP6_011724 [Peronosclerospora sorghi]|uniref:Uncharacterized protein n=1 Tax=Peronosclerospora sorghi TaxID=230839 RepID=A0ACC0WHW6_9STRA|nr:hypothetical protein PsorP6_011724 [Peronosclerospora sorghi]